MKTKKKTELNTIPKWKGTVIPDSLNERTWAGIEYDRIKTYPSIKKGTVVEVCDSVIASGGSEWYYIRIEGKVYGFVNSGLISKK